MALDVVFHQEVVEVEGDSVEAAGALAEHQPARRSTFKKWAASSTQ